MRFTPYDRDAPFGYAPGVFPSMELSRRAPQLWRALLLHPDGLAGEGVQELIARAKEHNVRVEEAPRVIERIAGKGNCYAVGVFDKCLTTPEADRDHLVLVNPSDMGNLGANIRTAAGLGVSDIVIIRPAADPFDPKVVRASMGALFQARIALYDSFSDYAEAYARERFYFRLRNALPMEEAARPDTPVDFVFGNEASGLPDELQKPDTGVRIWQTDSVDSLNLSVAVGIGLYHFKRSK